jgi:hypothetical protein
MDKSPCSIDPRNFTSKSDLRTSGVYGLRLNLPETAGLLVPVPSSWAAWTVRQTTGADRLEEFIGTEDAAKPVHGGGSVHVDRRNATTTFSLPAVRPDEVIVHPMLSFTAVVAARWRGAQSFHAGAVVIGDGAWAVLGLKGAGKSTLLASFAAAGHPVLCDDVLVIEGDRCLAGPRSVDLRHRSATRFPAAGFLGIVDGRERWRLPLGQMAPEIPLRGWIVLEWGEPAIVSVGPAERFALLAESLAVRLPPPNPQVLFDLARLPMLSVARTPDLERLEQIIDAVTDAVEQTDGRVNS